MKKFSVLCLVLLCSILLAAPASASTFSFGNSQYTLVQSSGITWDDAKVAAESLGGHLATITSSAENDFFKNTVFKDQTKAYWLGASQTGDNNRKTPTEGWSWVTGENWDYTDWSNAEPNNANHFNEIHLSADSRYGFQWNDEGSAVAQQIRGYVVEVENTAPTPIPGAIWLLGAALVPLIGIKSRFNANA
ncbi:lectin-like protein [Maridesulfovibrio sp.]|uniref:lectin-like protein n=1 Tax=Maridesulfovibrio sp. TaxID=2795000 RepID=UPI002A18AB45|nr:lectin-like protein [Maridesulfovibrio sp.]